MGLDGVIVGAIMSDKEESTTDKNGNHQPSGRSHFDVGKSLHDRLKAEGKPPNGNPKGKNPGDVFREKDGLHGKSNNEGQALAGKVIKDRQNEARDKGKPHDNALGHPNGKNPGDVFKDLQEQGKRFKVSDIEETTIGEPLENRKYAKVDTAKILGQGQTIHQRMKEARKAGSDHDSGLNNPSGKNPGDIFEINTRPFAKAHFATFPPALPTKILKASCPKQVCKKCGKPREAITDHVIIHGRENDRPDKNVRVFDPHSTTTVERPPTDWQPSQDKIIGYTECDCKAGFEAGTVLDPFFGAGTVGIVAEELSLNWIGIELKKEYADIATERLKPYITQHKLGEIE